MFNALEVVVITLFAMYEGAHFVWIGVLILAINHPNFEASLECTLLKLANLVSE
jgi:hypothetical protein